MDASESGGEGTRVAAGGIVAVPDWKPGLGPALREVWGAYRVANRMIWSGGLWRYWLIPAVLGLLYLPLLVLGITWISDWLAGHMKWGGTEGSWGWWVWRVVWWGVLGVVGWLTYRSVVLVFHAPFLDAISERVEKELRGRDVVPEMGWFPMAMRSLRMAALTGVISMAVAGLNLGMLVIPVVGWVISVGVLLPVQLWLGGVQAVDPCLGRNGRGVRASLGLLRRRWLVTLLVGGGGALILLIPVLGWFIGPTYLVVAGVVTGTGLVGGNRE
jgi:uncharacterized protein involved in cysteine biosynthesis